LVSFSGDFETGDYSEFTGTIGPPEIVTSPVYKGNYCSKAESALGENRRCYKDFAGEHDVYTRIYVRWKNLCTVPNYQAFITGVDRGVSDLFWAKQFGTNNLIATLYVPTSIEAYADPSVGLVIDTWYLVEVRFLCALNGGMEVWFNKSKLSFRSLATGLPVNLMGYDTSPYEVDRLMYGQAAPNEAQTNYIDNVRISNSYIGGEILTALKSSPHGGL